LFRTAITGILLVTRLPFGVCAVAGWYGAYHLTKRKGVRSKKGEREKEYILET